MKRLFVLAAVALLLAGCTSAPAPTYYRVDFVPPALDRPAKPLDLTLAVPPFKAPEPLSRSNILYRTSPLSLKHNPNRLWLNPPVKLVHQHLVRAFRASGSFDRLTTSRLTTEADLVLKGRLTRFEQVYQPDGWYAQVALWIEVETGSEEHSLFSGEVSASRRAETETTEALAAAMAQALGECLSLIVGQVDEAAQRLSGR